MQLPAKQRPSVVLAVVVLGLLWVGAGLSRVAIETPIVATVITLLAFLYVLSRNGKPHVTPAAKTGCWTEQQQLAIITTLAGVCLLVAVIILLV